MKKYCLLALTVACFGLSWSGCASTSAHRSPTADLSKIKSVYVVHLPADRRGVNQLLSDQLNVMGYAATTGEAATAPKDVTAVLTYQDKWMWDITMYMIELHVQLRDPSTQMVLASADTLRPSLQRKSPAGMVKETLESLLKQP